ncbi:hypothetical protein E1A91_D07G058800v1 [Gossypium mustelinum]|uniref:Uncharacterized protein n=1 Tax=Gossypium mustelinum TaxID=34275 RepID=A0A5D2U6Z4_GOSMU|nr:hypothetical protein E1A91_D07G058800v1 [Gossypium mustelinum]
MSLWEDQGFAEQVGMGGGGRCWGADGDGHAGGLLVWGADCDGHAGGLLVWARADFGLYKFNLFVYLIR